MTDEIRSGRVFLKAGWERLDAVETDQSRGVAAPLQEDPPQQDAPIISLPRPADVAGEGKSLFDLISTRKSRRKYVKGSLKLEQASYLAWATAGIREARAKYSFRTVPSAGARHPLDLYLYASRVEGVESGLYRYLPLEHALVRVALPGDASQLDEALCGQYWNAALVFIWVAVPYRTEWRYSLVSHKLIALDAGHSCQNLYLACEALGLGTCAIGAYDQEKLDAFLGLDGDDRFAVYAAPVGPL